MWVPVTSAILRRMPEGRWVDESPKGRLVGGDAFLPPAPAGCLRRHRSAATDALVDASAAGGTEIARTPASSSARRALGLRRHLAAHAHLAAGPRARVGHPRDQFQDCRVKRIEKVRDRGRITACGEHVLRQIVGSDREEVGIEGLDGQSRGGDLDHHPESGHRRVDAGAAKRLHLGRQEPARLVDLVGLRHHWKHHLQITAGRRPGQCPELRREDLRAGEGQPYPPQSEKGVGLALDRESGNRLVAARVERAHRHRPSARPCDESPVAVELRLFVGQIRRAVEQGIRCGSDRCRRSAMERGRPVRPDRQRSQAPGPACPRACEPAGQRAPPPRGRARDVPRSGVSSIRATRAGAQARDGPASASTMASSPGASPPGAHASCTSIGTRCARASIATWLAGAPGTGRHRDDAAPVELEKA